MIKAIIFDLGNVLLNYDLRKAADRFSRDCGVSVFRLWFHFLTSSSEKDYMCGKISSTEFFRRAKKSLGLKIGFGRFRNYWNDIFTENPGMESVLIELKRRYPLYLLSNTNAMHYEYLKKKFPILRHFRLRFASHEVGCRKPDEAIFRKVLKRIRLAPSEVVFIDDMRAFVAGAKKIGIHAIRFRNKDQMIRDLRCCGIRIQTRTFKDGERTIR